MLAGRFHGSYEAVYGGWAGNAFTAVTGGISEKMKTSSTDPDEPLVSADKLFRRLHNALASGAFVTATAVLPTTDVRTKIVQLISRTSRPTPDRDVSKRGAIWRLEAP